MGKEQDWIEDFHLENGCYFHICFECLSQFTGHKRRVICKTCLNYRFQPDISKDTRD